MPKRANPTLSLPSKHFIEQMAAMTGLPEVAAFIPPTGTAFQFISP